MKTVRLFAIFITLLVALSLTFAAVPAYAEDASSRNVNVYQGQGFSLKSVKEADTGRVVGVQYSGMYFGGSGIEVTAQIYSDNSLNIDFPINEYETNLTAAQKTTQAQIIALAKEMHNYIVGIDNVANTQYDGLDGTAISDIYRFNHIEEKDEKTIEISEDTYNMLGIARQMYQATNGAFNPAVYRLVDLWGFSSRTYRKDGVLPYDRIWSNGSYPLPDEKYVKAFSDSAFTDFGENAVQLSQENGKFYVTKNVQSVYVDGVEYSQWLDLGGVAKGYVVDGIRNMLYQTGATRFYVDAGTSSQAYGYNYDGDVFTLLTRDPYKTDYWPQPTVVGAHLSNATVSSSGQYERKYVTNGVEYAHIIDGTQGKPAQTGVNSITIIAPQGYSATMGDCLTTALTVMGKDRVVEFMNGYLKDNGIKVLLTYETVDGGKQLITNYSQSEVVKGDSFDEYAWSVKTDDEGNFVYDASAKAPVSYHDYKVWIIVLSVVVVLAVVAVIIVHYVKGKGKTERNVINAKRDKPFKIGDIGIYLAVVLLIVVLFAVFLGGESEPIRVIQVVDFSNPSESELLFAYNVARDEWVIYSDNAGGWTIQVTEDGKDINVKFSRVVDDQEQFNIMTITRGTEVSVKMLDASCDGKICVYGLPEVLTQAERTKVCDVNKLRIITN